MRKAPNLKDMIFVDSRRDELWARVDALLACWAQYHVVDVACGYGRFCGAFHPDRYEGVDFSDEMIRLAKETYPGRTFRRADVHAGPLLDGGRKADIIFEVNSLKSLGMTADAFIQKYSPYAKVAVAVLEADEFRIAQVYPKHRR